MSFPAIPINREDVMKKLKLESLEVTSFETGGAEPLARGTVHGRAKTNFNCPQTLFACPTDPNFDCTYGCSNVTGCINTCTELTNPLECVIE
jgi:hypothetical protein